jgi:hypothetical protein
LLQKYLEIRDTWLRFSSLESKDGLPRQKKLLLVSKIVDKNKKPSSGGGESESEDGGGTKHKTTELFADLEAVYNPNEVSQYTIGVNTDNIKKRTVNDADGTWRSYCC